MSAGGSRVEAWRAVVRSHAALTDRVQKALTAADLPPLSWFEILAAVERTPDGHPRMSELAEWLTLSRGGITKLVDRLQDAGCLERVSCSEDRRSLRAALTPAGRKMLGDMRAVYDAVLEQHLAPLSTEEAAVIVSALGKVTGSTCAAAQAAIASAA